MTHSLLPLLQALTGFPSNPSHPTPAYPTHSPDRKERYVPFHLTFADYQAGLPPIGVLRPEVVCALQENAQGQQCRAGGVEVREGDEVGVLWQFFMAAYPSERRVPEYGKIADGGDAQQIKGANGPEKEGIPLKMSMLKLAKAREISMRRGMVKRKVYWRPASYIARLVEGWKAEGRFATRLKGWRNEHYQVFYPLGSSSPHATQAVASTSAEGIRETAMCSGISLEKGQSGTRSNTAFTIERAAGALFGLPTYGVHMTAYEGQEDGMRVWVPRRAMSKSTFPGYLDNAAAGGIPCGMSPIESMIKECEEEVGWPDKYVRDRTVNTGVVTYRQHTKDGFPISEVLYTYDLHLPPASSDQYIPPNPPADEFESFELLDIPTIRTHHLQGQFKPASGAVMLDFLLRHGHVNAENEPNLVGIKWRLSVPLGLAMPC